MSKVITVVERAYHGTLEEQYDTILWMAAVVKNAGGNVDFLLRGNAVNYTVNGQDASGLSMAECCSKCRRPSIGMRRTWRRKE